MSEAAYPARTTDLAACFQEVLTATLRLRTAPQTVENTGAVRTQLRSLLQTAMNDARALGYTSAHVQMGVLVVVGFLDETVLNLQTPAASEWSRRPLQEELFGGHLAGETVFQNLQALLQEADAPEIADTVELHALCLELGYRGRYAFSNGGELRSIVQLCRDKVYRVRGAQPLFAAPRPGTPVETVRPDRIARALLIAAIALFVLTAGSFAGYQMSLGTGLSHVLARATPAR